MNYPFFNQPTTTRLINGKFKTMDPKKDFAEKQEYPLSHSAESLIEMSEDMELNDPNEFPRL